MIERQITGQMSISDVLGEWEKTKRAAEAAMQEAEKRRLEAARKKALKETEEIMDRLKDIVPELEAAHTSFQTGAPGGRGSGRPDRCQYEPDPAAEDR